MGFAFLATAAYTGYVPRAPGTAGSLLGLPLAFFLASVRSPLLTLLGFALFFLGALRVSGKAEILLGEKDSGKIVLDGRFSYRHPVFIPLAKKLCRRLSSLSSL